MMTSKRLLAVAVSAALYAPLSVFATNGMNMEGYGPIATAMGGASMAYDNGTAAMANNAATLGLAEEGNRVDVAIGVLSPDITSEAYQQDSSATQFLMPAMGWANKSGSLAYGAGVFAQGGMGTEYDVMLPDGSTSTDRSEVGVGRFIIPVAYNVNEQLTVGGSLDYVWASMDLQMTAPASMLGGMVSGGTMAPFLAPYTSGGMIIPVGDAAAPAGTYGRFDFSDGSDYKGEAKGAGFAPKLGLTYKVMPALTVGFNYQGKTAMSDLETGDSSATMTFYNVMTPGGATDVPLTGKVAVKDFQWPQTFALGMAYQASDALMVVADIKQIGWSGVMEDFKMTFTTDAGSTAAINTMTGGSASSYTLDVTMPQDWEDQTVIQLGAAYKLTPAMTGRVGINRADNPVPDDTVNPLFPAIVKSHYTAGVGYDINTAQAVNFSFTYAPEMKVTGTTGTISHSQMNWQLMYSHKF